MKKLIAILVVFAVVAGAAFAQGWGVWGSGEIGTIMNFVPKNADDEAEPWVGSSAYNNYGWYGGIGGELGAEYNNGNGLKAGITFTAKDDWNGLHGALSYSGDNVSFQVEQDFMDLLNTNFNPGRLWGWYEFLDGMIHLEIAANSRDTNYWNVTDVLGNVFDSQTLDSFQWSGLYGRGLGWGFMSVDHHNYLVTDVSLSSLVDGLSLGFMIPGIFNFAAGDGGKWGVGVANSGPGYVRNGSGRTHKLLVDESLKLTRFGLQYKGLVDASLQFALLGVNATDDEKVNTGLDFDFSIGIGDNMKAALEFQGEFDGDESDNSKFGFGGGFYLNGLLDGRLNAGLEAGFQTRAHEDDKGVFGIRPKVAFNLIQNYLAFSVDTFFFVEFDEDAKGIGYEVTPTLWFNVAGTGAGADYWWPNTTAIIVRYKIGGNSDLDDPNVNALDITFKWAF